MNESKNTSTLYYQKKEPRNQKAESAVQNPLTDNSLRI